jgi:hypothetical protein
MGTTHTIEEYLNSLLSNIAENKFNLKDVWNTTAKRVHWSDIGFESEVEYSQYLAENPYSNL